MNNKFGGKAIALQNLHATGVRIPAFKAVCSSMQRAFLQQNGLLDVIQAALSQGQDAWSAAVKTLQHRCVMPEEAKQLWLEVQELLSKHHTGIIRSSAACEDGETLSFAGMFESLPFDVQHAESFYRALIAVWLSPFKPHVVHYLRLSEHSDLIDSLHSAMGLLIQPMMSSQSAGVGFSTNPMTAQPALVVKAVRGNGEALNTFGICQSEYIERSGKLSLQSLELQKVMLQLTTHSHLAIGTVIHDALGKLVVTRRYQTHLHNVRVPKEKYQEPCLSLEQREQLYSQFELLLQHYGKRNFEFEWLVSEGLVYIVQARPITAVQTVSQNAFSQSKDLVPIVPGDISGEIIEWRSGLTREQVKGKIIYTYQMNYDLIAVLDTVGGIITQIGDSHAHAAIICRELGVSVYRFGQRNALKNGQIVTIKGGQWDVAA
jgi:phosphoenolpyruvate synthase/pyruvate phosphate dikinase